MSYIVEKNSSFDLFECLHKLITDLDIIQRDINFAYRDSMHFWENIISICKNYSALIYELTNLSKNTSILISMLYINIVKSFIFSNNTFKIRITMITSTYLWIDVFVETNHFLIVETTSIIVIAKTKIKISIIIDFASFSISKRVSFRLAVG